MPPRTKACAICRKKRIKCDATLPRCLMCTKTGHQCPGPLDGPLIMDMTTKAKHGMQKRKQKRTIAQIDPQTLTISRISQRAVITEAFYGRLLAHFPCEGEEEDIQNKWTWLQCLPQIATNGSNKALTLALQATASAFCAAESADMALKRYAWDSYGSALATHKSALQNTQTGREITIHMISTSILFSLFEAIQATTVDAYRSHVYGAAKMLEMTGPRECTLGVLCQIFFHVRTQMAFVRLASGGASSSVSSGKILYEVLMYKTAPVFQNLMNGVAALVDIRASSQAGEVLDVAALEALGNLEEDINSLWHEYSCRVNIDTSSTRSSYPASKFNYRNAFTALTVSYFSSARILLDSLNRPFAPLQGNDCALILKCSTYLRTTEIECAYMRMAMPLLLVALYAPTPWERIEAVYVFEKWKNGSMRGISMLALDAIKRAQKIEDGPYADVFAASVNWRVPFRGPPITAY